VAGAGWGDGQSKCTKQKKKRSRRGKLPGEKKEAEYNLRQKVVHGRLGQGPGKGGSGGGKKGRREQREKAENPLEAML